MSNTVMWVVYIGVSVTAMVLLFVAGYITGKRRKINLVSGVVKETEKADLLGRIFIAGSLYEQNTITSGIYEDAQGNTVIEAWAFPDDSDKE